MKKKTMKAAVLYEINRPLEIKEGIEIPALKRGQVLVALHYAGICHSQLMEVAGKRGEDKYLPHMLGHEGSGTVVNTGPDVSKVKAGDKVVVGWIKGEGIEAGGMLYPHEGTVINAGPVTAFSDYAIVSENRCYHIPEGVPLDVAVFFGCAIPTGCGIVIHEINPEPGCTMAIFGIGGIGLSALMATKLFDLQRVIAVDIEPGKLALAEEFGVTDIINASQADPVQAIRQLFPQGVDYSLDASGQIATIEQAFAVIRRHGGLCVFASHPETGKKISLDPHDLIAGKQIRGSWGGNCRPDQDIVRFGELYKQGRLPLEKLLSQTYSLEQINCAISDLAHRKVMRPLIDLRKNNTECGRHQ